MPDPSTALYFGVPGFVYLWVATVASALAFCARVRRYIRVLVRGRPEVRWDHPWRRLLMAAGNVLAQRRLLNERLIGTAHLVIFWAFVAYVIVFLWSLTRGLLPFVPIPYPDDVGLVRAVVAAFGILGMTAVVTAGVRRYVFTPWRLERSRDATLVLTLIAVVLTSSMALLWFRDRSQTLATAMWWLHMATVLAFLAYLPRSKHLHLLAAPFSAYFATLDTNTMPPGSEGAARLEEFTWRQLLNGLACAECGRCDRECPAFAAGEAFSPRELMQRMKELVRSGHNELEAGDVWACSTCGACMERCPVFNEHIPVIVEIRRHRLAKGAVDEEVGVTLNSLARYGNSFGQSPRRRPRWTQHLDFEIKDARQVPVEFLWVVGDYASFDPRALPATCATARVLRRAGVDFGILYESERNAGNDLRRLGEEGLFESLIEMNRDTWSKARFDKILTTDPHTFHVLKNEYPRENGAPQVFHIAEVMAHAFQEGKLPVWQRCSSGVTYHDPCYLGRYNGVYDAPRRVLKEIGAAPAEMPRTRSRSACCGAGGGRIWMHDKPGPHQRAAESRVREAATLAGVSVVAVACPKDLVMLQDAAKSAGLDQLAVRDIVELVDDATCPSWRHSRA